LALARLVADTEDLRGRPVRREEEVLRITEEDYAGTLATIRREFVGSRADLEAMNRAISELGLRPVIDRSFGFEDAVEAYRSYADEDSFGKVVVTVT
jgi:NADPH:quinone reductase-like Zn-dependent oxidoreductase